MINQIPDSMMPKKIFNYYSKHCSEIKWKIQTANPEKKYNLIFVIPVLSEYENIKLLLESLIKNDSSSIKSSLFVFVVNNLKSHSSEIKANNFLTLRLLKEIIFKNPKDSFAGKILNSNLNIALVNAAENNLELPEKFGGVGLARKIGMDLSLQLFNYKNNKTNLLVCLDADCTVNNNYISTILQETNNPNIKAGYVKFEHPLNNNVEENSAIICYELFLRYYLLGLKYSRSPFAFHTIGSTMFATPETYVKIGGMNKRLAAEDFYFMEKLGKDYEIAYLKNAIVFPSSRSSWRVPFGTGQRVSRFLSNNQNEYLLYSPKSFEILRQWNEVFLDEGNVNAKLLIEAAGKISSTLSNFLVQNKFLSQWNSIMENANSPQQISKQKKYWFDGFKTLKLVHLLRDKDYPLINMFDALDQMLKMSNIKFSIERQGEDIPSLEIQRKYLSLLRNIA